MLAFNILTLQVLWIVNIQQLLQQPV